MFSTDRLRLILPPILIIILFMVWVYITYGESFDKIGFMTTATDTPTFTPTSTDTPTASPPETFTPAPTNTPTNFPAPAETPVPPTNTPTPTNTPIPPTNTPTPTNTPIPPTNTSTPTNTPTPPPPTLTPTNTPNPVVRGEAAVLRISPGDGYQALATLPVNTPLEIVTQLIDTDWLRVTVPDSGVQGWLKRPDIAGNIDPNIRSVALRPAPIPIAPLTETRAEVYQTHPYRFEWNWPNHTLAQFGDTAIFSFKILRTTDGGECHHTQTKDAFIEFTVDCGEAPGNYYWEVIVARWTEDDAGWEELSFPSVPQYFDYKLPPTPCSDSRDC